jgi:hypothetical protein
MHTYVREDTQLKVNVSKAIPFPGQQQHDENRQKNVGKKAEYRLVNVRRISTMHY